jgi:hypothetical protein
LFSSSEKQSSVEPKEQYSKASSRVSEDPVKSEQQMTKDNVWSQPLGNSVWTPPASEIENLSIDKVKLF